jgi:hypothetical protein
MWSKNSRITYALLTVMLGFVLGKGAEADARTIMRVGKSRVQRTKTVKRKREIPRAPSFLLGMINLARTTFDKKVTQIKVLKPSKVVRQSYRRGKGLLRALYLDIKDTWDDPYQHYFDHQAEAAALRKSGKPFQAFLQSTFIAPVWVTPIKGSTPSDNKR